MSTPDPVYDFDVRPAHAHGVNQEATEAPSGGDTGLVQAATSPQDGRAHVHDEPKPAASAYPRGVCRCTITLRHQDGGYTHTETIPRPDCPHHGSQP